MEPVELSVALVRDALQALGWTYTEEEEGVTGVTFHAPGKPSIHLRVTLSGSRLVVTSGVTSKVPRSQWASALVDINEYNARRYRPKLYLSLGEDADSAMLLGEDCWELPAGVALEHLKAWLAVHVLAYADAVAKTVGIDFGAEE